MIAETMLGHGDRAHDYYLRINPSAREKISEIHRCEPYVYAQMIAGSDAPTFGEAKNSWLTGAAAWNYVAISQYILGIRPSYDGLTIQPVIPTALVWFHRQACVSGYGLQHQGCPARVLVMGFNWLSMGRQFPEARFPCLQKVPRKWMYS